MKLSVQALSGPHGLSGWACAPQEPLLGGKNSSRLLEGKEGEDSPGLADEHDETWERHGWKRSHYPWVPCPGHWMKACDQENSVSK